MSEPDRFFPGYCGICGKFRLITQDRICGDQSCIQRATAPEPDEHHVCNLSSLHKPGHPDYRQCSCGQWLRTGNGYWYKIPRPPLRWLREHGMDTEGFWDEPELESTVFFGDFAVPGFWRSLLRWLRR